MNIHQKKAARRIIALFLSFVFVAAFMLCGMDFAKYLLHTCNNSDCRICDLVLNVDHMIKQFICVVKFITIVGCGGTLSLLICCRLFEYTRTLVCLKTRLNH